MASAISLMALALASLLPDFIPMSVPGLALTLAIAPAAMAFSLIKSPGRGSWAGQSPTQIAKRRRIYITAFVAGTMTPFVSNVLF